MESQTQVLGGVHGTERACWIIDDSKPYRGSVESYLLPNETVAYSGGQTFDQYNAEHGGQLKLINGAEFDKLRETFTASMITAPRLIDVDTWDEALNCLPPCRWHNSRGVNLFHISERITENLVSWYARLNGQYYTFTDTDNRPSEELAAKVAAVQGLA